MSISRSDVAPATKGSEQGTGNDSRRRVWRIAIRRLRLVAVRIRLVAVRNIACACVRVQGYGGGMVGAASARTGSGSCWRSWRLVTFMTPATCRLLRAGICHHKQSRSQKGARGCIHSCREGSYARWRELDFLPSLTSRVARQRRCQEVRRAAGTARKRSTGWAGRGGAPATRSRRRTRRQDREERGSSRGRKSESRKRRSIASDSCVADERVVPISLVK